MEPTKLSSMVGYNQLLLIQTKSTHGHIVPVKYLQIKQSAIFKSLNKLAKFVLFKYYKV